MLNPVNASASKAQVGFIEVLLSFLSNTRTLFHKIAIEAFASFASALNLEGLRSLTDILDTEESLEEQRQLFTQDGEEADGAGTNDDSHDVSEDDSGDASDVEMIDGDQWGSGGESSSDITGNTGEDSQEDEELLQFDNMLAMTLQTSKPTPNGGESDDFPDESDMDDEQMMVLDPHLSNIFKQRSQIAGTKQRKDAKQNMVQFKSRVLDLLAVFLDKQHSNPIALEALLPMLRLIRTTTNKQLSDKSAKVLRSTFDTYKTHHKALRLMSEDVDSAWEVLEGIHAEANIGGGASVHANSCSAASLHLVRILVSVNRDNYARVVDMYADMQKQWFMDKTSSVQPILFTQFLNWTAQSCASKSQK